MAEKNGFDMLERQTSINKAFGEMYFAIYSIDMESGQYLEVSTLDIFREYIPPTGNNQLLFDMVVEHYVSDGYKEKMREFLNMETLQQRLSQQNAVSNEFFGTTQGWCRASFVVEKRDEGGKVLRFVYVTQEINEEVQSEQARIAELKRAYAAADAANRAKSDFLFQMSHDIRTPLNAIMGFGTLIEDGAENPARVREYAGKIRTSGALLLSLLNEMMDMTKLEGGQTALNPAPFSLSELIGRLENVIRTQTDEKRQQFTVDTAVTHDRLIGDGVRISRILLNILGNAVKYTPPGGSIALRVREEESGREDAVSLMFSVRDTGIGMTPELKARIFEKFSQGESNMVSQITGVGLGLTIAKQFALMMGGDIRVESEPGKGSEFTVQLSLQKDESAPKAAECAGSDCLRGLRVLIVEDNEMNMEIMTGLLDLAGAQCDSACNGLQALEKVACSGAGAYDLVLMDVCMPEMDGYETTRRLRAMKEQGGGELPIIALTANAFREDAEDAKRAGMDAHLAKPLDMALLKETVNEILCRKREPRDR